METSIADRNWSIDFHGIAPPRHTVPRPVRWYDRYVAVTADFIWGTRAWNKSFIVWHHSNEDYEGHHSPAWASWTPSSVGAGEVQSARANELWFNPWEQSGCDQLYNVDEETFTPTPSCWHNHVIPYTRSIGPCGPTHARATHVQTAKMSNVSCSAPILVSSHGQEKRANGEQIGAYCALMSYLYAHNVWQSQFVFVFWLKPFRFNQTIAGLWDVG